MRPPDVHLRDPFVLVLPNEGRYLLFGTTDRNCWRGPGTGFEVFEGRSLDDWSGPRPAFRPPPSFWGTENFWAPEVHPWQGRWFLFASFRGPGHCRGTQVFVAERPEGPYLPHSDCALTPPDWECLDGSLFVDEEERPWLVFCHEWLQVRDGEIYALPLAPDLSRPAGPPRLLFRGSEAPWTGPPRRTFGRGDPGARVTDGPFLHRTASGNLLMLWSSFSRKGYALGLARSATGRLEGPWIQGKKPLVDRDGGHGMVFRSLEGRLLLALHRPNASLRERPCFLGLQETEWGLELEGESRK
jgi:hypothetical protein